MKYHVKQFTKRSYVVVNEHGIEIYDGKPFGKDRPIIFHDWEKAQGCAERLNNEPSEEN